MVPPALLSLDMHVGHHYISQPLSSNLPLNLLQQLVSCMRQRACFIAVCHELFQREVHGDQEGVGVLCHQQTLSILEYVLNFELVIHCRYIGTWFSLSGLTHGYREEAGWGFNSWRECRFFCPKHPILTRYFTSFVVALLLLDLLDILLLDLLFIR